MQALNDALHTVAMRYVRGIRIRLTPYGGVCLRRIAGRALVESNEKKQVVHRAQKTRLVSKTRASVASRSDEMLSSKPSRAS